MSMQKGMTGRLACLQGLPVAAGRLRARTRDLATVAFYRVQARTARVRGQGTTEYAILVGVLVRGR